MRPFAVEAKPSQAKKLGFGSNIYLVAGSEFLHVFGDVQHDLPCEVTTDKPKNCVMGLRVTTTRIGDCEPRPKVEAGWVKADGLWSYQGESVLS